METFWKALLCGLPGHFLNWMLCSTRWPGPLSMRSLASALATVASVCLVAAVATNCFPFCASRRTGLEGKYADQACSGPNRQGKKAKWGPSCHLDALPNATLRCLTFPESKRDGHWPALLDRPVSEFSLTWKCDLKQSVLQWAITFPSLQGSNWNDQCFCLFCCWFLWPFLVCKASLSYKAQWNTDFETWNEVLLDSRVKLSQAKNTAR